MATSECHHDGPPLHTDRGSASCIGPIEEQSSRKWLPCGWQDALHNLLCDTVPWLNIDKPLITRRAALSSSTATDLIHVLCKAAGREIPSASSTKLDDNYYSTCLQPGSQVI